MSSASPSSSVSDTLQAASVSLPDAASSEILIAPSVENEIFIVGARVSTAYGRGVVTGIRASPNFYEVRLDFGTAALVPSVVRARRTDDLTFDEVIADTDALRAKGNAAYAAKDFDAAIFNYNQISVTLALSPPTLTIPQKAAMREAIVKALSNSAQARISKGDLKSAEEAVRCTCHALEIDPMNECGQREKLQFRRATALITLKEYADAIKVLKDPIFASHAGAAAKIKEAKEAQRKQEEREREAWRKGFAKAAAVEATSPSKNDSTPSSPPRNASSSPRASAAAASENADVTMKPAGVPAATKGSPAESGDGEDGEEDEGLLTAVAIGAAVVAVGALAFFAARKIWTK